MYNSYIYSDSRITKSFAIVGFLLVFILNLQSRFLFSFDGYELSMYAIYPSFFWGCVIFALAFVSISIVYLSVFRDKDPCLLLFAVLILIVITVISLPIVRDYYLLGRGDVLTQLGHIKFIAQNHQIPPNDIYPPTHLLAASIYFITEISANKITLMLPVVLYLLFSTVMFSLAKRITHHPIQQSLIIVSTILPIYGHNITMFVPHDIGFFYLPTVLLAVAIMLDCNKMVTILLFLVSSIAGVLYHPMNGIWLILICFLIINVPALSRTNRGLVRNTGLFLVLSTGIMYTIWYFSKPGVQGLIARELTFLLQGSGSADISTYSGFLGELPITYLLEVAFWRYGMLAIVTGSVFLSILLLYISTKFEHIDRYLIALVGAFSIFTIATPTSNFIILSSINRLGKFNLLLGGLVIGLSVGKVIYKANEQNKNLYFTLFCVFIITISTIGGLTVYNGPSVKQPGQQVTQEEIAGHQWIFEHESVSDANISGFGLFPERYYYAIYGERNTELTQNFDETSPPPNFGYDENATIGAAYNGENYLIVSGITKNYYKGLYPNQRSYWRYTPEDVKKLSNDWSAEQIYTTNHTTIYSVK